MEIGLVYMYGWYKDNGYDLWMVMTVVMFGWYNNKARSSQSQHHALQEGDKGRFPSHQELLPYLVSSRGEGFPAVK